MISRSLKIFKVKAKPGPSNSTTVSRFNTTSLFPRRLCTFTVTQNGQIDPEIERQVLRVAAAYLQDIKHSKPHRLNSKASFASLGLDSLDSIDLVIELEERLGLDVSDHDAEHNIKSIPDAARIFTNYFRNLSAEARQGVVQGSFLAI
jgi:acyl carrier protein